MISSLAIILVVPLGLLAARQLGFVPNTQLFTAIETIIANLCWLPPLMAGWPSGKSADELLQKSPQRIRGRKIGPRMEGINRKRFADKRTRRGSNTQPTA